MPVVASDVGMNADIIHNSGNGFLATTSDDWFASLYKVYCEHELRKEMGLCNRIKIMKDYNYQDMFRKIDLIYQGS